MRFVGYARVSTQDQDTALQLDALSKAGCTVIFQEKASGASRRGRHELTKCLASLQKGDVLVVYKIDRIARSLFDLLVWCLKSNHQIMVLAARVTDAKMVSALLCHTNGLGSCCDDQCIPVWIAPAEQRWCGRCA